LKRTRANDRKTAHHGVLLRRAVTKKKKKKGNPPAVRHRRIALRGPKGRVRTLDENRNGFRIKLPRRRGRDEGNPYRYLEHKKLRGQSKQRIEFQKQRSQKERKEGKLLQSIRMAKKSIWDKIEARGKTHHSNY